MSNSNANIVFVSDITWWSAPLRAAGHRLLTLLGRATMKHAFGLLLLSLLPAIAMAQGAISLKAVALIEQTVTNADGTTSTKMVPAESVRPGTDVFYRISFTNVSDQTATGLVINDPIPESMVYKVGSAYGANTTPQVSVDNGSSYGDLASLTVLDELGNPRPATASDVTHVRWLVNYPLNPGDEGSVSFRATLN